MNSGLCTGRIGILPLSCNPCPRFLSFVKKQNKNVASEDCLVHSVGVLTEVTVKNRGLHETGPPGLGLLGLWALSHSCPVSSGPAEGPECGQHITDCGAWEVKRDFSGGWRPTPKPAYRPPAPLWAKSPAPCETLRRPFLLKDKLQRPFVFPWLLCLLGSQHWSDSSSLARLRLNMG